MSLKLKHVLHNYSSCSCSSTYFSLVYLALYVEQTWQKVKGEIITDKVTLWVMYICFPKEVNGHYIKTKSIKNVHKLKEGVDKCYKLSITD